MFFVGSVAGPVAAFVNILSNRCQLLFLSFPLLGRALHFLGPILFAAAFVLSRLLPAFNWPLPVADLVLFRHWTCPLFWLACMLCSVPGSLPVDLLSFRWSCPSTFAGPMARPVVPVAAFGPLLWKSWKDVCRMILWHVLTACGECLLWIVFGGCLWSWVMSSGKTFRFGEDAFRERLWECPCGCCPTPGRRFCNSCVSNSGVRTPRTLYRSLQTW